MPKLSSPKYPYWQEKAVLGLKDVPIVSKPPYGWHVWWKGHSGYVEELPKGGYKRKFLTALGRLRKLRRKYRTFGNLPEVMNFVKDKWEIIENTEDHITVGLKERKGKKEKLREVAELIKTKAKKKLEEV